MQQSEDRAVMGGVERRRVEAVVETLATLDRQGESVAEVAHDARNMVTALGLYCDLLEEPGVLATPFTHYGNELRLVAAASRRLVEKLVTLDASRETNSLAGLNARPGTSSTANVESGAAERDSSRSLLPGVASVSRVAATSGSQMGRGLVEHRIHGTPRRWDLMPATPIENMAAELLANHNLLAALAGPTIALTVDVEAGARPVRLTGEDLTRVLVNLVKNAAEALPGGGRIQIELSELPAGEGAAEALALTIEDNGPGISDEVQDQIFTSGYTTRAKGTEPRGSWPVIHRGLGLSITRSVVEAAGGRIFAAKSVLGGARIQIELPVRRTGY
ncbi:MAG: ATP-binding protein [Terracidiphilus sp.]